MVADEDFDVAGGAGLAEQLFVCRDQLPLSSEGELGRAVGGDTDIELDGAGGFDAESEAQGGVG